MDEEVSGKPFIEKLLVARGGVFLIEADYALVPGLGIRIRLQSDYPELNPSRILIVFRYLLI